MNRRLPSLTAALAWACVGLSLASVAAGCHRAYVADDCGRGHRCGKCKKCSIDNCSDVPADAIPLPVGTYSRTYFQRQNAKAEADDFVIYWNHFQENSTKLSPFGSAQLLLIAKRLATAPYPVVIQIEKDPEVNRLRRQEVVTFLLNAGIPNAAERVVLGWPGAEGLHGETAERLGQQYIEGQGGFQGSGIGFSGFGGFGFGGFGGGGFGFR